MKNIFPLILVVFLITLSGCPDLHYNVTIGQLKNADSNVITATPSSGLPGTEINLKIADGYQDRLIAGTLKYNETVVDEKTLKFNLPAHDVVITAEFLFDPDMVDYKQTDEMIQGAWVLDYYTLIINATTIVVRYNVDVMTPYRTDFSYTDNDRFSAPNEISGNLTLFDYKDNEKIATIKIVCAPGETLKVTDTIWNVEEYYYANAFPREGIYTYLE